MNIRLILSSVLAAIAYLATAEEPGRFTISGHVTNVPDSTSLSLYRSSGKLLKTIATDTIINGQIHFTDTVSGPKQQYLLSGESRGLPTWLVPIWVEPGAEITVSGDGIMYPLWEFGSTVPEQASESALTKATLPEFTELLRLQTEETEIIKHLFIDLKGAPEHQPSHWARIDSIRALSAPLLKTMDIKKLVYLGSAPIDQVWLNVFSEYAETVYSNPESDLAEPVRAIYGRLTPEILESETGQKIKAYLTSGSILAEGDCMIDGILYDTQGRSHSLAEFSGKHILLDFWSRGCGPCIASMPEAEEVAAQHADRLAIVSISLDTEADWKDFLAGKDSNVFHWNELSDRRPGLAERYGAFGIPYYVLISPDGTIISKWSGYGHGSLHQQVSTLLK
ncbi:MAG: AhpC/TSA family protein [Muribaculaceae bacterium]|nr:AhpC/TSA family protein [Muribaculaceae bacterium]